MENYHSIDFVKVGARIRKARKTLRLTQEKAAECAFISVQFWSRVELGYERASVNTYWQMAEVLGLTLDDLFYDDATVIRMQKNYSRDGLLEDCTDREKAIISEVLLSLKAILVKNHLA